MEEKKQKTLQDIAKSALLVQNASNLSGVVHSLSEVVSVLRAQPDCEGSDWIAKHPVTRLYIVQICHLAGISNELGFMEYARTVEAVERMAASNGNAAERQADADKEEEG